MEIHAEKREITGHKVKSLREKGLIPAILYSKKTSTGEGSPLNLQLDRKELEKLYKAVGETALINVVVKDGKTAKVLINEISRDPVTLDITHVAFFEVDLTEKITANIPVEVIGEENCAPIKSKEGILITLLDEIEVECLPSDLPSNFVVDISNMKEVGEVMLVKDGIKVDPEKVEIKVNLDEVLLKIDYAEQLEVVEEERTVADIEVTTEKPVEEGEEAKDGESKDDNQKAEKSDGKDKS